MAQFKCLNVRSGSWRHTRQCLSPSHSHVIDLSPQHWAESIDFLKLLATVNPHWQQDVYLPGLLGPHYCPRCAKHWWLTMFPIVAVSCSFFCTAPPLFVSVQWTHAYLQLSINSMIFQNIYCFHFFGRRGNETPFFLENAYWLYVPVHSRIFFG